MDLLNNRIAILGCGNIGTAIAEGLVVSKKYACSDIFLTRRNKKLLKRPGEKGFKTTTENKKAVESCGIIIIAVTPQQIKNLVTEIRESIIPEKHIVISVASGASIKQIKDYLKKGVPVVRVMPNTAIAIQESMTCICANGEDREALELSADIFNHLGETITIKEELMVPATALCACGIAFFLRAIRAASQGGIEIGFHAEEALFMAAQTAKGAAAMIVERKNHPEKEVDKVTTPLGCTISGLNEMEHCGFSSSMIKGIVTSAKKASLLYSDKG